MISPAALLIFFLWVALGLTAAAPGIVGGDSGELTAAAFHLGSAHAPGYPLFITLGHLFELLPLGTPAFRMTFLSILAQAAAFLVLAKTLEKSCGASRPPPQKRILGLLTGGMVMAGPLVFHQLVSPEVFALHFLFMAVLLRLVLFPEPSKLPFAGFMAGAALSHQHLSLLALPALAWAYRLEWKDGKKGARAASLFLLGFSPYLILSLRAVQNPLVNWGNPSNFDQFLYQITRSQYGGDFTQGSLLNGFWDFYLYGKDLLLETFGVGLALLLTGFIKDRRSLRAEYYIGAFCLFALLPFLIRGGYDPQNNHINEAFLTPAFLWFSPLMLKGLESILGKMKSTRALLVPASVVIVVAMAFYSHGRKNDARNLAAGDVGVDILSQLPPHSVLFSSGDSITFPLAYLKLVKKLRPDVDIFDRTGGLFPDLYHLLDYQIQPNLERPPLEAAEDQYKARQHPDGVYYSEKIDTPSEALTMTGLLFREIDSDGTSPPQEILWKHFRFPRVEIQNGYFSRESAARYYLFKASYELNVQKDLVQGQACLIEGKRLGFDNSRLLLNAGVLENAHGWSDLAALSFERASQLEPANFLPWYDRGIVAENQKKSGQALTFFQEAVRLNPGYVDAHQHLGFQYFQAGLFEKATREWETVRRLNPDYAEAYRTLGYMAMQTRPDYAAEMFQHYLHLVPNPPDKALMLHWITTHPPP